MRRGTCIYLTMVTILGSFATGFSIIARPPAAVAATKSNNKKSSMEPTRFPSLLPRGGGGLGTSSRTEVKSTAGNNNNNETMSLWPSLYGTAGILYILAKAIKRVIPIALEPFHHGLETTIPLTQFQLGAYIVTCLWFAYVEGYKGFQQKFSPMVVKRSFSLVPGENGCQWWHFLLAPLYSMGLVHATRKRLITSWSVTTGIAAVVVAVKRLPYPWRNIVDAGVVAGLTWGSLSIFTIYVTAWIKRETPHVSAELPPLAQK